MSVICLLHLLMSASAQSIDNTRQSDASDSSDGISPVGAHSSPMSTNLLKRKHLMARGGASAAWLDAEVGDCLFTLARKYRDKMNNQSRHPNPVIQLNSFEK